MIHIFWVLQIKLFPTIRSKRNILFLKSCRKYITTITVHWKASPFDLYRGWLCVLSYSLFLFELSEIIA